MAVWPLTRMIEGMSWSYYFPEPYVRSALAYQPLPGDVVIVGYPKCGTTWLRYLVYGIYSGGVPPQNMRQFSCSMPFLERQGAEHSVLKNRPDAIKTHLPCYKHRYSPQARYLYITRNPFDCCVSYYYHTKHMPAYCFEQGTFDDFFELFITGDVEFGDYFDHLLSWYAHRSDPNVLLLTYEELKGDTAGTVVKIASFLGDEYAARLRREPALVGRILEGAALGNMKKAFNYRKLAITEGQKVECAKAQDFPAATSLEELVQRPMTGEFVRKGAVGDWKGLFSPVHVQRMLERIRIKTAGSDVMDLWKDIDIPR
ncbi:sulfotransferase ssu-1 [Rhipicephalus sanguineus]|uniref:sulfotransferase ssu-1 n=1 Tax=Rhipicephalus sanguineus TaxID=34632 RepID=UPI0018951215|nr:sulfotransferase ssu-1 [Rhipicephalus sanguineus]